MNKLSSNSTRIKNLMASTIQGKEDECGLSFPEAVYKLTKRGKPDPNQGFKFKREDAQKLGLSGSGDPSDNECLKIVEQYRSYTDFKTMKFKVVRRSKI